MQNAFLLLGNLATDEVLSAVIKDTSQLSDAHYPPKNGDSDTNGKDTNDKSDRPLLIERVVRSLQNEADFVVALLRMNAPKISTSMSSSSSSSNFASSSSSSPSSTAGLSSSPAAAAVVAAAAFASPAHLARSGGSLAMHQIFQVCFTDNERNEFVDCTSEWRHGSGFITNIKQCLVR